MMGRYRFQCKRSPSEGETCSQDECSCPSGLECGMYKTKGKKDKKTVCKEPNANSTMTPPIHGPVKNMKKNVLEYTVFLPVTITLMCWLFVYCRDANKTLTAIPIIAVRKRVLRYTRAIKHQAKMRAVV